MWRLLRGRQLSNFKFRRQHPIGPYIVDFVSITPKLVVEVDGGQHASQQDYDATRTRYLESLGYEVIRFWANEVLESTELVLSVILAHLPEDPSP